MQYTLPFFPQRNVIDLFLSFLYHPVEDTLSCRTKVGDRVPGTPPERSDLLPLAEREGGPDMERKMVQSDSEGPDYTILGYSEEMIRSLMRRTAETNAVYLLPYLRPGMSILDVGCGPGNISVGLAQACDPGPLYGIDKEESQVDIARVIAASLNQENAVFQVGEATGLPFEDDFFDVVHCHDVLMHIPDAQAALAEIRRVLKPGGIIGCREMIGQSCFTYPDYGVIGKSWEMFEDLVTTDGGHPQMGKELKTRLASSGFIDARITASFDVFSTPEQIDFIYMIALQWFLSQEMEETAIQYGAATVELAQAIRVAYVRWKDDPGAMCVLAFGEAVAFKP